MSRVLITHVALVIVLLGCDDRPVRVPPPLDQGHDVSAEVLTDVMSADVVLDQGPQPPKHPTVAIATWNVLRFFDTTCDSGNCEWGDYEALPSAWAFEHRVESIAASILRLKADVVLLQEIETSTCLEALQQALSDTYTVAELGEIERPGSVDVAVMARGTVLEIRTHRETLIHYPPGGTTYFARELLEVHLDMDGWRVVVFAAHFRSKVNDDPDRRLAEAMAAREIAVATAAEFPQALVVLGGDLNDTPGSAPLEALEQGGGLQRVASDAEGGQDWTYSYAGELLAIDHLFLATGGKGGSYVAGSAGVIRDSSAGLGESDHAGLRAVFEQTPP